VQPALKALDGAVAAAALEEGQSLTVVLGGEPVELSPDDVVLRVRGQQGFAVSREGGEVVALDLDLDDGLRKRGLSRDVVRLVQDLRKASGLEVSSAPGRGEGTLLELDDALLSGPVRVWVERVDPAA
jgi:isoleucyl-tRNA synthetase